MGKKYLDTKEGSLEQSILGLWQEAAGVKKEKLDPVGKEDGDIDNDGDKDSSDKYLMKRRKAISKAIKKEKKEEVELDEKNKITSKEIDFDLFSDEKGAKAANKTMNREIRKASQMKDYKTARKYMDKIQKKYSKLGAQDTEPESIIDSILGQVFKEEVELDEASVMVDLENDNPKLMKDIKKMGIKVKDLGDSGNPGYNEYELTGSPAALKKGGKKFGWDQQVEKVNEGSKEEYQKFFNAAMKKFGIDSPADLKSDEEKKKFFDYVDKNYKGEKDEEVQKLHKELFGLEEGKMSQLHQLIKDKKSAEEIAKIMKVDAKTIKALMAGYMSAGHMPESYEIGTDEYRKHTEDVTPGENGEWVDTVNKKNESMREALARVWGVNETKKDLTKELKDGKTMTGKKIAKVDVDPKIMEKKK